MHDDVNRCQCNIQRDTFMQLNEYLSKQAMPSTLFVNMVEQHIFLKQESARAALKKNLPATSQPDFSSLDMHANSTVERFECSVMIPSAILSTHNQRAVLQLS